MSWLLVILCLVGSGWAQLRLTPYLQRGDIRQARELSLVTGLTPNITSYSGFITVDEECNSNLFFWFFPSQNDWLKDPVTLWLNGGPGQSSLFGALNEHGPYQLTKEGDLTLREHPWNVKSSVIYVDNPVGTGYSSTRDLDCYWTDETQIGHGLLNALEQFLVLFPELAENKLYVAGESYAGKYVPAVGHAIHTSNSSIHLAGLGIGNGLTDPLNQLNFTQVFYHLGLISSNAKTEMEVIEADIARLIIREDYTGAVAKLGELMGAFSANSDYKGYFSFLEDSPAPAPNVTAFVTKDEVREALHVGDAQWYNGNDANIKLTEDKMRSVKPWLEELLEKYSVWIYTGQTDLIVTYLATANYLEKLNWSGAESFRSAEREIRRNEEGYLVGYSRNSSNLIETMYRNAGHYVPIDQPRALQQDFNRFIN